MNVLTPVPSDLARRGMVALRAVLERGGLRQSPSREVPLTSAQREIWLASQLAPAVSLAYHESQTLRLTGGLKLGALQEAVHHLVARHEALRATISTHGETQRIAPITAVEIAYRDFTDTEPPSREAAAADCVDLHLHHPFDLAHGPLFRVLLLRLDPETHLFVLIVHHLVCDGWSLGVLLRELGELYSAHVAGGEPRLAEAPSFADHAASEAVAQRTAAFANSEAFWLKQFADGVPVLDLPTDRPRPAQRSHAGGFVLRALPADVTTAVKKLCGERQCTPFTVMCASFNLLLHRLTAQDDVVVGVPAAGQVIAGSPGLVGHCANLLPLRSRFQPEQSFADYLAAMKERLADAMEHARYPFGRLVQALALARDASRVPLAPVVFNTSSRPAPPKFTGLTAEIEGNAKRCVNFDLNYNFIVGRETIMMGVHYSAELFERATIERWCEHFETLLRGVTENPLESLGRVPLLNAAQRRQILVEWNATQLAYRREACIHELFAERAAKAPDAVALVAGRERVTYAELDRRAERVAKRLRDAGVGPDVPVGIFLERNAALLTGMLGVLKAGAAYVPLDRASPPERMAFVIADTRMPVIVTQRSLARYLPPAEVRLLLIDDEESGGPTSSSPMLGGWESAAPSRCARPTAENLAYILYTSGSTGRPKGVCVPHRGVVALAAWAQKFYRPDDFDGVLCATSATFDVSVFESLVPLCLGGKIVIAEDILQLPLLPASDEVRFVCGVPSAVAELVRAGNFPLCVRTVNLAGEPCPQSLVDALYALPQIERVVDVYGPTETTVYSTGSVRVAGGRATIGRPLANERAYILDPRGEPVPIGVRGELCIGGDKLARGYLNRPELTAEKFVRDPFGKEGPETRDQGPGTQNPKPKTQNPKLYRTGDLARFLPDGSIEFLGRLDHQVKIRGYRIELGEIETVLARASGVLECVVVAQPEPATGAQRLLAYVTAAPGAMPSAAELRAHLAPHLPDYMIPAIFAFVPALPRTTSGKVDRRALPALDIETRATRVAPRNTTEEVLADIWREVLGREDFGVDDNFFELGGHSLLAARVISRINGALGAEFNLQQFFAAPTIATMANAIEAALIAEISGGHAVAEAQP